MHIQAYSSYNTTMFCIIIILLLFPYNAWLKFVNKEKYVDFDGRRHLFTLMHIGHEHSWYEAFAYCAHKDMDLVTIDSWRKNTFVAENLQSFPVLWFWIGLKSDLPEVINEFEIIGRTPDNFHWFANHKQTKLSYTNWCSGYPKPTGKGFDPDSAHDVCGGIRVNETCWKTFDCIWESSKSHAWVCEDRTPKKTKYEIAKSITDVEFQHKKYTFHDEVVVTWDEADKRCRSKSQKLVYIQSQEELEFIQDEVEKRKLHYWIGLAATVTDSKTKQIEWSWTTQSSRKYFSNWCSPDQTLMEEDDHCAFIRLEGLCWQNWQCDNDDGLPNGFICKD